MYHDNGKSVDSTCKNHGSDLWARNSRLYNSKKRKPVITKEERKLYKGVDKFDKN